MEKKKTNKIKSILCECGERDNKHTDSCIQNTKKESSVILSQGVPDELPSLNEAFGMEAIPYNNCSHAGCGSEGSHVCGHSQGLTVRQDYFCNDHYSRHVCEDYRNRNPNEPAPRLLSCENWGCNREGTLSHLHGNERTRLSYFCEDHYVTHNCADFNNENRNETPLPELPPLPEPRCDMWGCEEIQTVEHHCASINETYYWCEAHDTAHTCPDWVRTVPDREAEQTTASPPPNWNVSDDFTSSRGTS